MSDESKGVSPNRTESNWNKLEGWEIVPITTLGGGAIQTKEEDSQTTFQH